MKKDMLKDFVKLISDSSITDDAWGDVFILVGHEMMNEMTKNYNEDVLKGAYLKLKNAEFRFKFIQIWSKFEDFKNFEFFIDQISSHDVEIAEVIFDNLRSWSLNEKSKLELLNAIKQVDQRSKLLDITIGKLSH